MSKDNLTFPTLCAVCNAYSSGCCDSSFIVNGLVKILHGADRSAYSYILEYLLRVVCLFPPHLRNNLIGDLVGSTQDFFPSFIFAITLDPAEVMLSLLLSFPEDVIRNSVSSFLDIVTLCKLDSATLSAMHRSNMLRLLLQDVVVTEKDIWYDKSMIEWLRKRGINLQRIRFPRNCDPSDIARIVPVLSKVERIDLTDCVNLTSESVIHMLQECKSATLESVVLQGCPWVEDETLKILADLHGKSIHEFVISDCPLVTDDGAAYFLSTCSAIFVIKWENCESIGAHTMAALNRQFIVATLSITNCPSIPDWSLVWFLQNCNGKQLWYIVLAQLEQITDQSLLAVAQHCLNLRDFHVTECDEVTDIGVCAVIEACQQLSLLRVVACDVSALVMETLSRHASPHLVELLTNSPGLTEKQAQALATRCTRLQELQIYNAESLTDRALQRFGENMHSLKKLTIGQCPDFTCSGVQALVQGCPHLEELHFFRCPYVCDECLRHIAVNCGNLCQLHVTHNSLITDAGISLIAERCKYLQFIGLDATLITEVAVQQLVVACPELQIVSLDDGTALSPELVQLANSRGIAIMLC